MAWHRVGTRRYFYRYQWANGRAVRRYVGCGPVAELAAAADDLRRVQQAIERRERRAEQERLAAAAAPLLGLCEATDTLARAALLAAGFHQHNRGKWRVIRGTTYPPTGDGEAFP